MNEIIHLSKEQLKAIKTIVIETTILDGSPFRENLANILRPLVRENIVLDKEQFQIIKPYWEEIKKNNERENEIEEELFKISANKKKSPVFFLINCKNYFLIKK